MGCHSCQMKTLARYQHGVNKRYVNRCSKLVKPIFRALSLLRVLLVKNPLTACCLFNVLVSIDSTSSRDTRDMDISRPGSVEGSLSISNGEHRRGSKPKLFRGTSTRSFDKVLDGNTDKEPSDGDLELDSCPECGTSLEQFDEETLNLCIVVLSTFVYQSPSMAMPFLLRMLECVGR